MKPVHFPQRNAVLGAPEGWEGPEPCERLAVYRDGQDAISCWRPSLAERLRLLFGGKVWLTVRMGGQQPPVALETLDPWRALGSQS